MPHAEPFSLSVPDSDIADLRERLARTRWPDTAPVAPWSVGADPDYMRGFVEDWRRFDWRQAEAALNALPNYRVELDGIPLHFLNVPGHGVPGVAPMPLLLMHGWPGSVFEFLDIIPRLTDPARFGGDPADAFTVVAPSLPGYGLSFRAGQRRVELSGIADLMVALMMALGFSRFAVQGGDWGAHIATNLGARHAEKLVGLHLNLLSVPTDAPPPPDPTPEDRRWAEECAHWNAEESGYALIQGTRPQTLAFALTDSPAGLAAWIVEKFRAWTDNDGLPDAAVPRAKMLANISFYWFTGAIGSSFWPYYSRRHGDPPLPPGRTVDVPVGYAAFPREIRRPPRRVAAATYTDIRRWTRMARGGHFAALEQPQALAEDVAAFFRTLR